MTHTERMRVNWFNENKGYGFLNPTADPPDEAGRVYVHWSTIAGEGYKALNEGEIVECTWEDGPKGPQASRVVRIVSREWKEVRNLAEKADAHCLVCGRAVSGEELSRQSEPFRRFPAHAECFDTFVDATAFLEWAKKVRKGE